MKQHLLRISVAANVVLVAALLWMQGAHQDELSSLGNIAMRGDEIHLALHAKSLAALNSEDPDEVEETISWLRILISVGERNQAGREAAGLGD